MSSTIETTNRVLVIEDDEDTRLNLRDILELDDFEVEAAGACMEGLAYARDSDLLAIILDRKLPDGTAEELLPQIKRAKPDAAVIIVTGHADLDGAIAALRHHVSDYILKPINPEALRNSLRRIRQLHRTAAALRRSEKKYRYLFENANDLLIIVDSLSGAIVDANIKAATQLGHGRDELLSMSVADILPDATPDRLESLLCRDLNGRGVVESAFLRRDGTAIPVEISSTWFHDGGREAIQCFARDITERKKAEEALIQQRDFAESLIETAQAVVLVLDPQGRIVRFNQFLEQLSGYSLADVQNADWFDTFLPDRDRPRIREVFSAILSGSHTGGVINAIQTKTGQLREIAWWSKDLRGVDGDVTGVLSVGHDITELKRAQERLLQNERLSAIGQMTAGLAHESRNALQRSQACLELLQRRVQDSPKALELIARIQDAQDHLHQLYEEVRSYAAPIKLEKAERDLREIWRRVWKHLAPSRSGRRTRLVEEFDGPVSCVCDSFRIEQVFRNLIENSLAACDDPVEIRIGVRAGGQNGRPFWTVTVKDNGPGLAPELRERIFEPFFTTKTKGTGLGMAIVRRIVEAHEGMIIVANSQNGAEIVMELPQG